MRSKLLSSSLVIAVGSSLALFLSSTANAQLSYGGSPASKSIHLPSAVPTVTMPTVDVDKYMNEDLRRTKDQPFRFGAELPVDIGLDNAGVWDKLADGTRIWRARILSTGAYSINLIFSAYHIPDGAELYVYNDGYAVTFGSYNALNENPSGAFAIQPVPGEAITLEYIEPRNAAFAGDLRVGTVVHAYRDIVTLEAAGIPLKTTGQCECDVVCPEGLGWEATRRAVARLIIGGALCSGSMINNSSSNGDQLFITAYHCGALNSAVFQFKYEKPGCNSGSAPTNFTVQGSTQLVADQPHDCRLVRINPAIPSTFNIYFPGYDRSTTAPGAIGIHHPQGLPKKISFENNALGTTGIYWNVNQWDIGVTEPGSSGSPLYTPSHKYIGALLGGQSACGFPFNDQYPKLANHWTLVKAFLDPLNTNATTIPDYDPFASCGSVTHSGSACLGSNLKFPSANVTGCLTANGAVTLTLANGVANQSAFLYLGISSISVPVPNSQCTLLVSPLATVGPLPLDANGALTLPTTLPGTVTPGSVVTQGVFTDPGKPLGATFTDRMTLTFQ